MNPKHNAVLMAATDWDTSGYINLDKQALRVPPTPEDQIVIRRNWDRMMRWTANMETMEQVRALNRWCGDYLHN